MDAVEAAQSLRQRSFEANYSMEAGNITLKDTIKQSQSYQSSKEPFIFVSYTIRDDVYAHCLKLLLTARYPDTDVRFNSKTGKESELMHAENVACYVILLSGHYCHSKKEIDEFHMILSKQRASENARQVMYTILVDDLPPRPTYFHLAAIDTALTDDMWTTSAKKVKTLDAHLQSCADRGKKNYGEIKTKTLVAMSKATCDLERVLSKGR